MMTKGNTNFSNETEKFNHAVDLFFGMNPDKRLWILFMLYLGKERTLHIVDNYDQYDNFHIMARLDINSIDDQGIAKRWKEDGIQNKCVIADTPTNLDCTFDELAYALDVDSHNYSAAQELTGTTQSIFRMRRWEPTYLMEIAEIFISLSDEWYKNNASWAFNAIIKRLQRQYGREIGVFTQPEEITELVGHLLGANNGSVYNPYSGIGSYAMSIGKDCSYVGHDFSRTHHIIGKLNLLINGISDAKLENSIVDAHWKAYNKGFEYIVSTPPFALRLPESRYRTADLQYLAESSRDTQIKSIGVYPVSITSSSNENIKEVIAQIVNEDILETVILLPQNLFSATAIDTVIIVVNKKKEKSGFVRFIDASDCFTVDGRSNRLSIEGVFNKLNNKDEMPGSALISNEDIRSNNYMIYPKVYAPSEDILFPEGYQVVKLEDIIESCPGTRRFPEQEGHLAKISDLATEGIDCTRSVESFGFSNSLNLAIKVEEPVLLFSMTRELKPTFCEASAQSPIFVHPNVAAFRIKAEKRWVHPEYLCYELFRRAHSTFGVIPRISKEVLLKTKIGFPSFNYDEQHLVVKEAIYQDKLVKAREMGLQEVIDRMKADYINEVKSRKHDTKSYFRELRSIERNMRRYVKNFQSIEDFQQKMNEALDKYHIALEALSQLVNIFSEEAKFGEPEEFNINDYFGNLENSHDAESSGYELVYNPDINALIEAGLMEGKTSTKEFSIFNGFFEFKSEKTEYIKTTPLYVKIAHLDFERMVKNILENARDHGFTDPSNNTYELSINLSIDAKLDMYQIDFINNGNPLPEGMDKLRYGLNGEKAGPNAGEGKGGNRVKLITEHYGGDYDVFQDNENTVIRILLPISRHGDE